MLILKTTTGFRKDYKRMKKQGNDYSIYNRLVQFVL